MNRTPGTRDYASRAAGPAAPGHERRHAVARGILLCSTLLATVMMAGCGNLTAGGFGETTVLIAADGDGGGATASEPHASPVPAASAGTDVPSSTVALLGYVEITLQVFLRGPDGAWSELTAGERRMTLPLVGGEFEELLTERLGEGLYREARVVFHSVEAEVTGGLDIGGVPVLDRIRVAIVDPVMVERDIGLSVRERQPTEILIDLNAGEWLLTATQSAAGLEVSVEAFEAAVRVSSRSAP